MRSPEKDCRLFETCSAPLCPLDPGLKMRNWFPEEQACRSLKYRTRWIKKQRSIQKYHTEIWFKGGPWGILDLIKASRPRKTRLLTEQERNALRERLKSLHIARKRSIEMGKDEFRDSGRGEIRGKQDDLFKHSQESP